MTLPNPDLKKVFLGNIQSPMQVAVPYSCSCLHSFAITHPLVSQNYQFEPYLFYDAKSIDRLASTVVDPAVLGLSLYSWNRNRSLKLARLVKSRYPQCLVLLGGPEVPERDPEKFLREHPYIDILVYKEGEIPFQKILLENLKPSPDFAQIPGLALRRDDQCIETSKKYEFLKIIDYPSPFKLGFLNSAIQELKDSGMPGITIWETNRGCPYSCSYCDWGSLTNQKIRSLSDERVQDDIEFLKTNVQDIFIADANFGILPRDLDIAQKLANVNATSRLKTVHVCYAKNSNDRVRDIASTLMQSGLSRTGVAISLQSTNLQVLTNVQRQNMPLEKFFRLRKSLQQQGIDHYTELILGLPGETRESFLQTIDLLLDGDIFDFRVGVLEIFENAEISREDQLRKHGIQTKNWSIYENGIPDESEYIKVVKSTSTMRESEIVSLKRLCEVIDCFHLGKWTYFIATYLRRSKNLSFTDFYSGLIDYFRSRADSVTESVHSLRYLKEFNLGKHHEYAGQFNPFHIDWKSNAFRRPTFLWLCIAYFQEQLWVELEEFLKSRGLWTEVLSDCLIYQKQMMIQFDYDPDSGKVFECQQDWLTYFAGDQNEPTAKVRGTYRFFAADKFVGRSQMMLRSRSGDSFFAAAGGHYWLFQKMNCFIHRQVSNQPN